MEKSTTPILDSLQSLQHIKKLDLKQLKQLADELRLETINIVAKTGGHLGASLGVIELTIALHYVFDTPEDKLIWDVGHQTYPHKILTGRRDKMHSLRSEGGISGFTKRDESVFDPFGAGHSSTSVSAALGMATARDLADKNNEVIAVIGDGAMSAGMAYEAMNNAGDSHTRLIVILNDNKMSIAPAVGAMSNYLARLIASKPYLSIRHAAKNLAKHLPGGIENAARKAEKYTKDFMSGGNFFEEMGFYYVGPIDGHNISHLVPILKNIKEDRSIEHPTLIHVITEKGHGCKMKDAKDEKLHAVAKFDVVTKIQHKSVASAPKYQDIFVSQLIKQAKNDNKIVAITAAMPSGTGLDKFAAEFKERCFDVGIAEQHAVTFAAGMAAEGYKPYCAIYSTFLQRAYDQIVHDVAIQSLPVRFAIDRAGLVGADGPTHAGSFDITYLACLPGFIVMAPADEAELSHMIATSTTINNAPCAFRYPRGEGTGIEIPDTPKILTIGKGRVIKEGRHAAILSFGTRLQESLKAAQLLEDDKISATVADARFAKPIDTKLITKLAREHELIITVEEGSIGGFAAQVQNFMLESNLITKCKLRSLFLPDRFINHGNVDKMHQKAGLNADNIANLARNILGGKNHLRVIYT